MVGRDTPEIAVSLVAVHSPQLISVAHSWRAADILREKGVVVLVQYIL